MARVQTHAEWEEEMAGKILRLIRHELYLDLRFLEPALSAFAYRREEGLPALATDGATLFFSPEPLLRIFKGNAFFLGRAYLHTALHCVFRHLWLTGSRDPRLWGLACDIAAERVIDAMEKPCTKRILSWLRQEAYAALAAEGKGCGAALIYRWLLKKDDEELLALAREFHTDDHRHWPKEGEQNAPAVLQARRSWERKARQAALELERRGGEPGEGQKLFAAQMKVASHRRSYQDFLRKFAVYGEEARLDLDAFDLGYYAYGLRLYGNLPLIEPLETREEKKIREFVIVIDTSDSTCGALVEGFLNETYAILSQKNCFFDKFTVRVLQCDDKVRKDDTVHDRQELRRLIEGLSVIGGGGTDFRPAFSYVDRLREQGELSRLGGLLYFTDGKGTYPKKRPAYRTAFLFLEDYDEEAAPPWAMRLKLDGEEWLHEH